MSSPVPSEGERSTDPQSESVSRPVGDDAPPVRTKRTPAMVALLVAVWVILGIALVVVAATLIT